MYSIRRELDRGREIQPPELRALLEAAEWACQCADAARIVDGVLKRSPGRCGDRHESVCHFSVWSEDLVAAPADVTLTPAEAAAVPVADLVVWCLSCRAEAERQHRAAKRAAIKADVAASPALFDVAPAGTAVAS